MRRLRAGLLGAGLVGQAAHAFYLWEERELFDFVAIADASAAVRKAVGARYGIRECYPDFDGLRHCSLDALVIATPDPFHAVLTVAALNAGIHVMCEKPLALTSADCDEIAAARDRSGCIVQVAYMKRYDPAYRRALELLPGRVEEIKLISVEVNDPDQVPFVAHLPMTAPNDLSKELRQQTQTLARAQLTQGAGRAMHEAGARALANGFLSALVHDVAVVHGMLAHLDVEMPVAADYGAIFDDGYGVQLAYALPGGGRVSMTHLNLPGVPDYCERITVYAADRIIELTFPSPYLRHHPTRLTLRRPGSDHALETCDYRVSYEEAFREELRAFYDAATGRRPVETSLEEARQDIELLTSAFRKATA